MRILTFAFGFLILVAWSTEGKKIRGLDPSKASLYQPSSDGFFSCLDGSKRIPFERVNDDYCDCKDGSDEPGTSACHNGEFYCANKGSSSLALAAAFVDDGLCDCCDGSDEIIGCPNRCLEESAPLVQELREKMNVFKSALEKKNSFQQEAVAKKTNWLKRSETISAEIDSATAVLENARVGRDQATQYHKNAQADVEHLEARAKEEKERRLQEESAAAAEQASQDPSDPATHDAPTTDHADHQAEDSIPVAGDELAHRVSFLLSLFVLTIGTLTLLALLTVCLTASFTSLPPDDREAALTLSHLSQEETDEERGRRIASQWTSDPDAAAGSQEAENADDMSHHEEEIDDSYEHQAPHYIPPVDLDVSPELQEARALAASLESEARGAEAKLSIEEKAVYELQVEKRHIDMFAFSTHYDFGPDAIFYPYAGRCFEDRAAAFLYKVCFFDHAAQLMPSYPAHNVSLGVWTGLTSDYSQALFEGGDACVNHPNRSLRVFFSCSREEKLHTTTEPTVCSYTSILDTPLACHDHEYYKLKEELDRMEAGRAQIQAEIDAAAKDEL